MSKSFIRKILLILFILTCGLMSCAAKKDIASHIVYASAFLIDPKAPAIHASAFIYDPHAAPIYASAFISE